MAETEKVNFYNPNDGIHGRDGGPYLDQEQQVQQERLNAFREDREPDYANLPLHPGIQPVSETALVQGYNSTALAGQANLSSVAIEAAPLLVAEVEREGEDDRTAKEKRADSAKAKESEEAKKASDEKSAAGASVTDNVKGDVKPDPTAKTAEPVKSTQKDSDEIVVE